MRRTWRRAGLSLLAAVTVVPLLTALLWPIPGHHRLEVAGWAAGVAALLVAAATLLVTLRPPARPSDAARDLESFAAEVDRQWRAEAHARRLPLGVTDELHLTWSDGTVSGTVEHLVALAAAMPVTRLAVLGAAGSGKSSTLVLLTLGLLARRRPGDPVPVLVPVADWDPGRGSFDGWLVHRLSQYATFTTGDTAWHLVRDRKIVPVVDGLDEAPPQLRHRMLRDLAEAPGDLPFVLACRTGEFHAAAGGGPRPDRVLEVELRPLSAPDAIRYLRARCRWDATTVRADSPLAAALTSPLLVHLIATLYRAGHLTVADLNAHTTAAGLEQHLLQAYVPAVFTAHTERVRAADGTPEQAEPLVRAWSPQAAHRWLTELATDMTRRGETEYLWWDRPELTVLPQRRVLTWRVPEPRWLLTVVLAVAVLAIGFPLLLLRAAPWIATEVTGWPVLGLAARRFTRIFVAPTDPVLIHIHDRVSGFLNALGGPYLAVVLAGSLVVASAGVACCVDWKASADPGAALHPDLLYRADRAVTVRRAALLALALATILLPPTWAAGILLEDLIASGLVPPMPPPTVGRPASTMLVIFVYVTAPVALALLVSAWGVHVLTGIPATLRRRRPARLMSFLADAAALGILRTTGAGYQFRHVRLQHSLAESRAVAEQRAPHQRLAALFDADGRATEAAAALAEGNTDAIRTRLADELVRRGNATEAYEVLRESATYADAGSLMRKGIAARRELATAETEHARNFARWRSTMAFRQALRAGEAAAWPELVEALQDRDLEPPLLISELHELALDARTGGLPRHRALLAATLDSLAESGTGSDRGRAKIRAAARRAWREAARHGETPHGQAPHGQAPHGQDRVTR
ncbi:hypothetical protein AB0M02_21565 [Actinoplanes sp. NPDC051861]|uniref:hypothetical protein n=1 Tax=Actinoplanes sp. NPDC051861 TaxID=3155170 RepID=UPI0034479B31